MNKTSWILVIGFVIIVSISIWAYNKGKKGNIITNPYIYS